MDPRATNPLTGLRVLLAEDHPLIAQFLRDVLLSLDCTVIGPTHTLEDALRVASTQEIDAALLDLNLGTQGIYPVAQELARRSVPFILVTGQAHLEGFPPLLRSAPLLVKPFTIQQLEDRMKSVFGDRPFAESHPS
jgi:DNA-binding response OmpR family regulator